MGAAVPQDVSAADLIAAALFALTAVGPVVGLWLHWRTHGLRGEKLERARDLLECCVLITAFLAFAAVLISASRPR